MNFRESTSAVRSALWMAVACALFLSGSGWAATPIPDARKIDWSKTGVPGGIPNRTTIYATINAATYGNGTTDASGVINTAIANCPANQVVYLPAGTYRLNSSIHFQAKKNITLRGAGIGKTILAPVNGLVSAITTGQTGLASARTILSGSTKGSVSITVDNATGITAGTILDIFQADDPDFYWTRGLTEHTGQYVLVTAVNGTTVQFEDPLVWGFDKSPRCRAQVGQHMAWCGVEDLTLTAGSGYSGSMIQFWNAYASWIKNVETAWGNGNEHIFLFGNLRCEVRDCYVHDTYSTTDGYGVMTGSGYGGPRGGCTGLRIENNIFSGLWHSVLLETEVGSVVAYNYSRNARYTGWPDYQIPDFNGNHGPHGMMCLFEGNLAGGMQQDGYHGSVSHITYFRNWFSGQHVDANRTGNIKCLDLCRFSYYHNAVGNVLGNPNWPRTTTGRYEMTGSPDYTAQTVIYRLGYPNMGNNGYSTVNPPSNPDAGGLDPKVKSTLMRWGNFDYQNNAARWEASELPAGVPVPPDHSLPASLYYSAKPAWWGALAWPPFGPDLSPMVNKLPAQLRYEGIINPAPQIATQPADRTVTAGQTATFSVVASGAAPLAYQWQKNGSNIAGAANASYTTPATTVADHGSTFRVLVSNSTGSISSNTVTLTVNNPRDFNSDRKADLLLRHPSNGDVRLWLMK